VQPVVGGSVSSSLGRYDSVLINRLRIGHTSLTNSYILKGESQPVCEACHSLLTAKHFLVDCTCYRTACQRYLEWTHSMTFLKMLHLATSSLMLKISTFTIVYNVVFYISLIALILSSILTLLLIHILTAFN